MFNIAFLEAVQTFGGARKSTVELASRLIQRGIKVCVVDLNGCCQPFVDACNAAEVPLTILDKKDSPTIISTRNKLKKLLNQIHFFIYALRMGTRLRKFIEENNVNYVVVNNSKVLMLLLNKPLHIKVILFARGWFINSQIHKIDRLLYKKLIDKYVCVSEATRQAIYASGLTGLSNLYVVHNAIKTTNTNIEKWESCHSGREIRILISGGFLPSKGLHIGLDIAKELKKTGHSFKITITGIIYKGLASTKYYNNICQRIKEEELADVINIVVNKNDVKEYFKWCDILLHPSDTEGLPRVVMEAMAFKKPVIANAVGGVTDYVLDGFTGFLPRYNHVADYVKDILLLVKDKTLYDKITDNAYELINTTFTEQHQVDKFLQVIEYE